MQAQNNELETIVLEYQGASARICTLGAHVLDYQPAGQTAVLWLSPDAVFAPGHAIRGGIPVCWPWFAENSDNSALPMHGFARTSTWSVAQQTRNANHSEVTLRLCDSAETRALWPYAFELRYQISLSDSLRASLIVTNTSNSTFQYSGALHSYFAVQHIDNTSLAGLAGCSFVDKVDDFARKVQHDELLHFTSETDRIYLDTSSECIIHDAGHARDISIAKSGSRSTVVWNPWSERAKQMQDFTDDEYVRMLCVETANAANDVIELAAGETQTLSLTLRSSDAG